MSDFMKEIKLSYEAYNVWQEIKHDIHTKLETYNDRAVLYTFNPEQIDLKQELIKFLVEQGFEVITGEDVWDNFPKGYDKDGFKHFCYHIFDMSDGNPKIIALDKPKIPCIIKW